MKIQLIRHGMTQGNKEKRYIGTINESILPEERSYLENHRNEYAQEAVEYLYVSPMRRCVETAEALYAQVPYELVSNLRECDFGDFENHNYIELSEDPDYQRWIDSKGTLPFPNGERIEDFKKRSVRGIQNCIEKALKENYQSIAFLVHGGTIMAVMEKMAVATKENCSKDYFQWQVGNLEGYYGEVQVLTSKKGSSYKINSFQKKERI